MFILHKLNNQRNQLIKIINGSLWEKVIKKPAKVK